MTTVPPVSQLLSDHQNPQLAAEQQDPPQTGPRELTTPPAPWAGQDELTGYPPFGIPQTAK